MAIRGMWRGMQGVVTLLLLMQTIIRQMDEMIPQRHPRGGQSAAMKRVEPKFDLGGLWIVATKSDTDANCQMCLCRGCWHCELALSCSTLSDARAQKAFGMQTDRRTQHDPCQGFLGHWHKPILLNLVIQSNPLYTTKSPILMLDNSVFGKTLQGKYLLQYQMHHCKQILDQE